MFEYQWIGKINNLQMSQSTRGKFYTAQGISYLVDENNRIIHWVKEGTFRMLLFHEINKIS